MHQKIVVYLKSLAGDAPKIVVYLKSLAGDAAKGVFQCPRRAVTQQYTTNPREHTSHHRPVPAALGFLAAN